MNTDLQSKIVNKELTLFTKKVYIDYTKTKEKNGILPITTNTVSFLFAKGTEI